RRSRGARPCHRGRARPPMSRHARWRWADITRRHTPELPRALSRAAAHIQHMPRHFDSFALLVALSAAIAPASPLGAQQHTVPGLDMAGMDTTVRPGSDFYRFANGGWDRTASIPADRSSLTSFATTD